MSVHHLHVWCSQRPEAGVGAPETGVACDRWELNPVPPREQPLLVPAEPSLRPPNVLVLILGGLKSLGVAGLVF